MTRKVTRTATVPLEGNAYAVDPALTGRRVELRYDPEDLSAIEVFYDGKPAGAAVPFVTRRGLPEVFYCDNGAPFANAWLARTCAVLGIRLVHSQPYSPPLTGQCLDHPPVI